jgi:ubiquinone/menaquinone biosynthesis methyltransferase
MENNIYNPEFVKGLFNRMSGSYERMNYLTSFGFSIRWRSQFLKALHADNDDLEIIDLLTGMGETWHSILHKFPNSNLTGLDFSQEMLKHAKTKSVKKFKAGITILQQDVLQNQLPGNHYDIVTCAFGLKTFNTEQLHILAQEVYRILKVGGQFSFFEVSKPNNIVLKTLYGFYLGKVIPVLGRILLGDPEEYRMLWKYTDKFVNAKEAQSIFSKAGLETQFLSYFYGCATGFNGQKL